MGDLVELRTLGVSSNRLESLPSALGRLELLEFLFANGNRLRSVPGACRVTAPQEGKEDAVNVAFKQCNAGAF